MNEQRARRPLLYFYPRCPRRGQPWTPAALTAATALSPSQKRKEKKNESSCIAFTQWLTQKLCDCILFPSLLLRCLIIILSLCLYLHCWGPLLCENCPLKIQPKNGISLGRILLPCVCSSECVRQCVQQIPIKDSAKSGSGFQGL